MRRALGVALVVGLAGVAAVIGSREGRDPAAPSVGRATEHAPGRAGRSARHRRPARRTACWTPAIVARHAHRRRIARRRRRTLRADARSTPPLRLLPHHRGRAGAGCAPRPHRARDRAPTAARRRPRRHRPPRSVPRLSRGRAAARRRESAGWRRRGRPSRHAGRAAPRAPRRGRCYHVLRRGGGRGAAPARDPPHPGRPHPLARGAHRARRGAIRCARGEPPRRRP